MKKLLVALMAVFLLQTAAMTYEGAIDKAAILKQWENWDVKCSVLVKLDECVDFLYYVETKKDEQLSNEIYRAINKEIGIELSDSFNVRVGVVRIDIRAPKQKIKKFLLGR